MSLVYVLPDIHGQYEILQSMLAATGLLGPNDAWAGPPDASLLSLGDLVDRGPRSRDCVERMLALCEAHPERVRVLLGNHEDMLLSENHEMHLMWLGNGGRETLEDYGTDFEGLCRGEGRHARWFRSLPLSWEKDSVLFCHGGLLASDPDGENRRGLLWARPPLSKGRFRAVVSGHTRTRSRRIEEENGIFMTDIGLAYPESDQVLELLKLETQSLAWEALPVPWPSRPPGKA